jgi:hypothetical protein
MDVRRVGIVGAGTMGNGVVHVFARSGYDVVLCDVEQRFLDRGIETIGKNLDPNLFSGGGEETWIPLLAVPSRRTQHSAAERRAGPLLCVA